MIKSIYRIFTLLTLCLFLVSWGSKGHYAINNKCPESFPASMAAFSVWADSLNIHGSDADYRKGSDSNESPKHYIDIDNYAEFISKGRIASTYDSIVNLHGSSYVISNGTLPWATVKMYDTLKVAFQQHKWHKAMLCASDLGHYVADGHMPLHLTSNYDGQKTGQSGIHSRYESDMVSTFLSNLTNYSGESVQFISNRNKYIFDYIYHNQHYVDSVMAADIYANNLAGNNYSAQYYQALWSKTKFTTMLFHNASHSLAELIYSAWVEAGSPIFGSLAVASSVSSTLGNKISVYPNPTNGIVNFSSGDIIKIEVCNISGILMGEFYDKSVDLAYLSNGMYILSVYKKNGLLNRVKVLLVK